MCISSYALQNVALMISLVRREESADFETFDSILQIGYLFGRNVVK